MTRRILTTVAGFVLAAALQTNARADVITVDAGWYGFCFGASGSAAYAGCTNDGIGTVGNDITFTATSTVSLNVTDAFQKGDTFTVDVNPGSLSFTTDTVPIDASGSTVDPNAAFADPTYSHGSLILGPGSYTVDIFAADSAFGGGGAYVEVVSATSTPETSSVLLLVTVAALVGFGARLKKRALGAN